MKIIRNKIIFSTKEQKRLTALGSVFHNKKSRDMWTLLSDNPHRDYYLKEIAIIIEREKNPRLPIYVHHINNLINSGMVTITVKMHNKHQTKFYRAIPIVMVVPPHLSRFN